MVCLSARLRRTYILLYTVYIWCSMLRVYTLYVWMGKGITNLKTM